MKNRLFILIITLAATIFITWLAVVLVPLPERLTTGDSTVIEWSTGEPAHVFLAPDGRWRLTTRLERVDQRYLDALIAYEDKRFYTHGGVDFRAVARAATSNIARGRVVSGASTLSMQLVRMVEPRPRTLKSKIIEAFRAFQLEYHMEKDDILANYLRFLPFGRNVEGLETAAWVYFGHDASALAPHEIATLLAVPQGPGSRYPKPENQARLTSARDQIAAELLRAGKLQSAGGSARLSQAQTLRQIQAHTVPGTMKALPRELPHLAVWLRGRAPNSARLRTTIDPDIQRVTEQMMHAHQGRVAHLGAYNASLVVVDHHSGALRAAVGNFDFHDRRHAGQLAGFNIRRSSGSLLKPFLLAHAIDQGHALPSQLVADVPVNYDGYKPVNYSEDFQGLVTLDKALQHSLNIPFVRLLNQVGVAQFLNLLRRMGLGHLDPRPGHYGLSVAVGGVDTTPLEIAELYTALARSGERAPVYMLERTERQNPPKDMLLSAPAPPQNLSNATQITSRGALSAGAARLVRDIIAQRPRPDRPSLAHIRRNQPRYAWKTGTSMGLRDAWTAGFGRKYTAVVWTGNFNNQAQTGIVGSQAAAPIFFDVLEAIDPGLNPAHLVPHTPSSAHNMVPGTISDPKNFDNNMVPGTISDPKNIGNNMVPGTVSDLKNFDKNMVPGTVSGLKNFDKNMVPGTVSGLKNFGNNMVPGTVSDPKNSDNNMVPGTIPDPKNFDKNTMPGTTQNAANEDLVDVEVCAYSGHVPTSACNHTKIVKRPAHSPPSVPCPYHQQRDVDRNTQESLDLSCRQRRDYQTESYVIWPEIVREVMRDNGYRAPKAPPPWAAGCAPAGADTAPRLISPASDIWVQLQADIPTDAQLIPLVAHTRQADAALQWFVDGRFLGESRDGRPVWLTPTPGTHQILVVDARGQSASVKVIVVEN